MRPLLVLGFIGLLLGVGGCSGFRNSRANPRNWFTSNEPGKGAGGAGGGKPASPEINDHSAIASNPAKSAGSGVLAGRIIDAFNQQRAGAAIQVVPADASPNESPIEATASDKGYFVVQGLEPGRRYRLTARVQTDGQLLAGTTLATPPNPVVLIKISEDLAGADTPPFRQKGMDDSKQSDRRGGAGDGGWSPEAAPKYLHEPDRGGPSAPPPDQPRGVNLPPLKPEMQTDTGRNIPPRAHIPGIPTPSRPHGRAPVSEPFGRPAGGAGSTRGSCTVAGNRVTDFTLPDLAGQPFQLSQNRRPLVLLDFWGSWCGHCIQGMPHLIELQRRYAPQGLEVIGIAYEEDGSHQKKIEQVKFVSQRQGVNYKILLGEGDSCPVLNKLDVRTFPTLILLDENGEIVWRGEGLSPQNKARLELEISRRLRGGN